MGSMQRDSSTPINRPFATYKKAFACSLSPSSTAPLAIAIVPRHIQTLALIKRKSGPVRVQFVYEQHTVCIDSTESEPHWANPNTCIVLYREINTLTVIVVNVIVTIHFQLNGTIVSGPAIDANAFVFTVLQCTLAVT